LDSDQKALDLLVVDTMRRTDRIDAGLAKAMNDEPTHYVDAKAGYRPAAYAFTVATQLT
jgi:hypothetical protein